MYNQLPTVKFILNHKKKKKGRVHYGPRVHGPRTVQGSREKRQGEKNARGYFVSLKNARGYFFSLEKKRQEKLFFLGIDPGIPGSRIPVILPGS
jgi:hypothetical protein